ncbi:translocation/assembly module TamB domain-containing protein [Catalinimonas sp. 4WD22]|uniref:translocation/assembly module TamB domain-containing protein n=1 Tax=Catalinimonas locisalis TaxID=3133978 RepID=UPI00310178F7
MLILLVLNSSSFLRKQGLRKVESYTASNYHIDITIGDLFFSKLNTIKVEQLLLRDKKSDTLMFVGAAEFEWSLSFLFSKELKLNTFQTERLFVRLVREEGDVLFNYEQLLTGVNPSQSKSTSEAEEENEAWKFSLGDISIQNADVFFKDLPGGTVFSFRTLNTKASFGEFDTDRLSFMMDTLFTTNTALAMSSLPSSLPADSSDTSPTNLPDFQIKQFEAHALNLFFEDKLEAYTVSIKNAEARAAFEAMNLNEQHLAISSIMLDETLVEYTILPQTYTSAKPVAGSDEETVVPVWNIDVNEVKVSKFDLAYIDPSKAEPSFPSEVKALHTHIKNISFETDRLVKMELADFGASLSDLQIHQLAGKIACTPSQSQIDSFFFNIENSRLQLNLKAGIGWGNYEQWKQAGHAVSMRLDDIMLVPADFHALISETRPALEIDSLKGTLEIQGTTQQPVLHKAQLRSNTGSSLDIKGHIDLSHTQPEFELQLQELLIGTKELQYMLSPLVAQMKIGKVERLMLQGNSSGINGKYRTELCFFDGINEGKVSAEVDGTSSLYGFQVDLSVPIFKTHHWVEDAKLPEQMSLDASVQGSTDLDQHNYSRFEAQVYSLLYPQHKYQNIYLEGSYTDDSLSFTANSLDEWAQIGLSGKMEHSQPSQKFTVEGNINRLELQPFLNWPEPLRLQTTLNIAGQFKDLDNAGLDILMHDFSLAQDTSNISFQKIYSQLNIDTFSTTYHLKADSINFDFQAEASLNSFLDSLQKATAIYQANKSNPDEHSTLPLPSFSASTHSGKAFSIGQLASVGRWNFKVAWDHTTQKMNLTSDLDSLHYDIFHLYHLRNNINGNLNQFKLNSEIDSLRVYDMSIGKVSVESESEGSNVNLSLLQRDDSDTVNFSLGTQWKLFENGISFRLDTSQLIYAGSPFHVNTDNYLSLIDNKLLGKLDIGRNESKIHFRSTRDSSSAELLLQNLDLGTYDENIQKAVVNGDLQVHYDGMKIDGQLSLDSLQIFRQHLPAYALEFSANKDSLQQNYEAILHEDNVKIFEVHAQQDDSATLEGLAQLHKLNLASLQPFFSDQLDTLRGVLDGSADWYTHENKLNLRGVVNVNRLALKPRLMDNVFYINDEQIVFTHDEIFLDTFTVLDDRQQPFGIDGNISLSKTSDPAFFLKFSSSNFRLFDIPRDALGFFSGKGWVTSELSLSGSASRPQLSGTLKVDKNTQVRFVSEDEVLDYQQQNDVLIFRSEVEKKDSTELLSSGNQKTDLLDEMVIDLDVSVDPSFSTHFILNQSARNDAKMWGGGNFSLKKMPKKDLSLNGIYLLKEGEIQIMTPLFTSRKLRIKEGSTVTFNNDPYKPVLNIELEYQTYASASAFFPNNSRAAPSMKFDVQILVQNTMEDLKLAFDFKVNDPDVQNALNTFSKEEKEIQALNLLFFNSFYVEGGGGFSARTEAEMLVANQLNRIANEKIKGVDLNFRYENSGTDLEGNSSNQSDLAYELSKQLSNRLTLRLGGYVNTPQSDSRGENLIGDIVLEYYLGEKKKNYLKIFRQNSYEGFFEGDVDIGGIGIVIEKNYHNLREIFKNKTHE